MATFTDADPSAPLSDYSVTVRWGDGTTSARTVDTGDSGLSISGSHTYLGEGSYLLAVTVSDVGGSQANATATATVADQLNGTATPLSAVEGTPFSGQVATFTDADTAAQPGNFSAIINWGDQASTGDGQRRGRRLHGHGFAHLRRGGHCERPLPSDRELDRLHHGGVFTAATTATVADAPLTATGDDISAVPGVAFTGTVATFTDTNPTAPPSDYTVTIDWGDGEQLWRRSGSPRARAQAGR